MSLSDVIQIAGVVAPILLAAASVGAWFLRRHIEALDAQVRDLREECERLRGENTTLTVEAAELRKRLGDTDPVVVVNLRAESEKHRAERDAARHELSGVKAREEQLLAERAGWVQAGEVWQAERKELALRCEQAEGDAARLGKSQDSLRRRVKRVLKLEGRGWEQHVPKNAPAFRPLAERRMPVVSVCNLKGGVGKTTVTAHLAAALTGRGYRVLLIDLDLQGSLSSLLVGESALAKLADGGRSVQHYLQKSVLSRRARLLDHATPVLGGKAALVPTTDKLAYAEENLLIQWLLRMSPHDARFLIRHGLHASKAVRQRFDIVLIDCPPFLSTCAVNALAASDYVLVPVTPSQKAAERAPTTLNFLRRLHAVNPALQVMGLLANRFHSAGGMTAREQDLWSALRDKCKDQAGLPVYQFATVIRQMARIADTEAQFTPPDEGSELCTVFHQLAAELEGRLPNDCRRTPAVPV